jgi:predicted aconitase
MTSRSVRNVDARNVDDASSSVLSICASAATPGAHAHRHVAEHEAQHEDRHAAGQLERRHVERHDVGNADHRARNREADHRQELERAAADEAVAA